MPRANRPARLGDLDFAHNFNTDIGLWRADGPGHTFPVKDAPTVHPIPNASSMLVAAALLERLAEIDTVAVLRAIAASQDTSGDREGCLKWYHEEPQPTDTNASFFTALGLIVLKAEFADRLSAEASDLLDRILSGLKTWFLSDLAPAKAHYPNKYLGDLSCAWMLVEGEHTDENRQAVAEEFVRTADYWLTCGWGWGEHMSDVYAWVCLTELAMLRTLARKMPKAMSGAVDRLTARLLEIEDLFGGQPRVPAIRSYAFENTPQPRRFREMVRPLSLEDRTEIKNMPPLGYLFHRKGWHDMVPQPVAPQQDIDIDCFDGTTASARVEEDIRLGGISRFPVMPSAEHHTWGLSWQCFPACLLRQGADWGFLQWQTVEDGNPAAHPAVDKRRAYLRNSLTQTTTPPLLGWTYSIRRGGNLLVLRMMPTVSTGWETLTDRFRLLGATTPPQELAGDRWSQLLLTWPERTASVQMVDLSGVGLPKLTFGEAGCVDWSVEMDNDQLVDCRGYVSLWGICLDGSVEAPRIEKPCRADRSRYDTETETVVRWAWPGTTWHVRIDPLADSPLVELDRV